MTTTTSEDHSISDNPLLQTIFTQLTEEQWTRTTIDNYSKRNFVLLDNTIDLAEKENILEELRKLCVDHLSRSSKSIIALYLAGILTYKQEIIDDSYILQIINLFKENKKWQVVEYLADKILSYGESKFALTTLEECYVKTANDEELIKVWERLSKVDYENGDIPKKLAVYHEKEGDIDESVFYYKMALKRFSKTQTIKMIEDLWRKLAELIPHDIEFFSQIHDEVARYNQEKSALLLSTLLSYFQENKNYQVCIDILKRMLSFNPKDKDARTHLVSSLKCNYKGHSLLEQYITKSDINDLSKNFKASLEKFEKYIVFDKGNYVYHRSWGIGIIIECKEDSLIIDFENKKNHNMSMKIALTSLKTLSENHVWIQKKRNSTLLKDDSPDGIKNSLILIFKSYNSQATMKEIKKEMTEVIAISAWTKWWNKAKQVMKTSSIFGNSPNKRDLYFLRDKPLTFEEESHSNFMANTQFGNKLAIITDYLKHSDDIDSEGFQQMLNFFVDIANNKSIIDERSIKSFLFLRKIKRENTNIIFELKLNPYELLPSKGDIVDIYGTLTENDYRKDILDIIKRNDADWTNTFLSIMKEAKASKSHNLIVDELIAHDKNDELLDGFQYLVNRYRNNPENYFWAAKTLFSNPELLDLLKFERKKLIFNLFHCLDIISKELTNKKVASQKVNRKLFPQIIYFLLKTEVAFSSAIKEMKELDAKIILALINGNIAMDEKSKAMLIEKLMEKFPELEKEVLEAPTTKEIHDFLVTKESYERKQKELQHIVNVEIPQNSKAIGIAQEKGDLRENADYIAALEHQRHLQEASRKLMEELSRIKIISFDDVDESNISVGTHVHLLNMDNNEIENYTILGEWESNMDKGIISYKSPFGKSLLGSKPNDTVVFDHGGISKKYKVEKIEKAKELVSA